MTQLQREQCLRVTRPRKEECKSGILQNEELL